MATLLSITPEELNTIAGQSQRSYSIASRCGVFAKSDIQALLNQGAQKNDIAQSILTAVVNQTIAGLAQGREIEGKVVYLGGPLTFLSQLRAAFDRILGVKGLCPENSLYYVAAGAALSHTGEEFGLAEITDRIAHYSSSHHYQSSAALFHDEEEYQEFLLRHQKDSVPTDAPLLEDKAAYVGIDAGSTTVKAVAVNSKEEIIFSRYLPNSGNPVPLVRDFLQELYKKFPDIQVLSSASTGYGEEIIKNAFGLDMGVVETIAHFTAAKKFDPQVDFIIDIGGQDIKCFKIKNGTIDNIFLNEACSSGCGSFLQTFAGALGYEMADFAKLGLFADSPVDLGSRCTVFMNSSVKQAQKDGASIENISAGLSTSVVKNALYKVIRVVDARSLGDHIVVQGGTFLNDAVLRAFEKEIGKYVIRPSVSGLMGAYGAALYSKEKGRGHSTIIGPEELTSFTHEVRAITCNGCENHCRLTVNTFANGARYIAGNRCDKPLKKQSPTSQYNMYDYKRELLNSYKPCTGPRGTIGIPMGLNMFELYPFWYTFFTKLGFGVFHSPESDRKLYFRGQHTIPSGYRMLPGQADARPHRGPVGPEARRHLLPLHELQPGRAPGGQPLQLPPWWPIIPEVLDANIAALENVKFIYDYVGLHRRKDFPGKMTNILAQYFGPIPEKEVKAASDAAYEEYYAHMERIHKKGQEYLALAKEKDLPVIVLSGRPYHLDPEINHGIDKLICECGAVLVTEDSVSELETKFPTHVLNQWTYHARLYAAAKFVADSGDKRLNLVQMVSFGCGVDAITGDEVRSILEAGDKIYTQIKIDEITNLGAVRIRLRSLFAALGLGSEATPH